MDTKLAVFGDKQIRRRWDERKEKWYFSVVDIITVLINQPDHKKAQSYWTTLKNRLKEEGSEVVTKCDQLKMQANDGKFYKTDAADVETLFRLIQSVPSPKAEPIKIWLAKVGYERIQEVSDPEKALNRSRLYWQRMGRSQKWIQQRMMGQETRNKLTDYWKDNEVKEKDEYAILTNIIHQEWSDLSVKEHKNLKKLKTQNLRDHLTDAELVFMALAELSTRQIAETEEVSLDAQWQDGYKRQMEIYQWLFRKNGFKVSDTGYFVYCNGNTDKEAFDGRLEFDIKLLPYIGDDSWVEGVIFDAIECLKSDKLPRCGKDCDFCKYREAVRQFEK